MHVPCPHRLVLHRLRHDPRAACIGPWRCAGRVFDESSGHLDAGHLAVAGGLETGLAAEVAAAAGRAVGRTEILAGAAAAVLDRTESAVVSFYVAGAGLIAVPSPSGEGARRADEGMDCQVMIDFP